MSVPAVEILPDRTFRSVPQLGAAYERPARFEGWRQELMGQHRDDWAGRVADAAGLIGVGIPTLESEIS